MVSIDGIRLRDLSVVGWLGLALAAAGGAWFLQALLYSVFDPTTQYVGGAAMMLVGAGIAYNNACAEVETLCKTCGRQVTVRSSRAGVDEAVFVRSSASPRRAHVGRFSIVVKRKKGESVYCSGECADADDRLSFGDVDPVPSRTPDVAATDGGEE